MNNLINVRTNIIYLKVDGEFKKYNELVFLVDSPKYKYLSGSNDITRENEVKEFRFCVGEKSLDSLIEALKLIKDAKEEDLV